MSLLKKIHVLMCCIGISFLPVLGAAFFRPGGWYAQAVKPPLNPPAWVFGPVWTTLYLLMGISLYRILTKAPPEQLPRALGVFVGQLLLNGLWSVCFFGLHNPGLALVDLLILWGGIVCMIRAFLLIDPAAAYLQIPYLIWVSFAGYLNLGFLILNR